MSEKREGQGGGTPDAPEAVANRALDLAEVVRAKVREFAALDVAPHQLGRIELGRGALLLFGLLCAGVLIASGLTQWYRNLHRK